MAGILSPEVVATDRADTGAPVVMVSRQVLLSGSQIRTVPSSPPVATSIRPSGPANAATAQTGPSCPANTVLWVPLPGSQIRAARSPPVASNVRPSGAGNVATA